MRVRLDILGRLLRESAVQWSEDNCLRLSAALAYYTAFSLAPLLVVATAVAGFFLGEEAVRGRLDEEIRALIGPEGARFIQSAVASARRPGSGILAGLIGTVALLLGSTAVFGELQSALNHVWSARPKREGGITRIVKARAASFAMVLSVAFVLLVSLVLSTALAAVGGTLGNFL
ncbi:MAG: YihY/virulence factor BrkB family protein, partial [Candidatus Binatia bacterium]